MFLQTFWAILLNLIILIIRCISKSIPYMRFNNAGDIILDGCDADKISRPLTGLLVRYLVSCGLVDVAVDAALAEFVDDAVSS